MAITFIPKRGAILMCDFDMANVPPEMGKIRQVAVVSPTHLNHRHGRGPGTALVVPFSTSAPHSVGPEDVFFLAGTYWSLPKDSWAKCKMLMAVSHDRLDLVLRRGKRHPSELLTAKHLALIEGALAYVIEL